MKRKKTIQNGEVVLGFLFLFVCIYIFKLVRVGAFDVVDGINMKEFASERDTARETLTARRGTIYDRNGEVLAQDVNSYTVIAYLDSSRTTDENYPKHVVDVDKTSKALSPILNMKVSSLKNLLTIENVYQVELGPGGRGITELVKESIEALDLPGIDFVATTKRYYPYGDFMSYTLGYATTDENNKIKGEFGIELQYDDILKGTDGYREYQKDLYGYKIVGSTPIVKESVDGSDVYLTMDVNIQMFLEQAIQQFNKVGNEFVTFTVADAKTGEILGSASNPSFDPNIKDIVNYHDPLVSYAYEPGSTMKIYTWMASIENGLYKGTDKYKTGSLKVADSRVTDWYVPGWGKLTYDEGLMISSNVGAAKLGQKLGRQKLMDFYYKLGFGEETGIGLPNEFRGDLTFKYDIEIANAAFGQGIQTTPAQNIAALTTLTNDGTLLKPFIVSKIVDTEGNAETFGRTEVRKVASTETIEKMKSLLYDTVNSSSPYALGSSYKIKKYDICGKTGTAQYVVNGKYAQGDYNNIKSFAGFFPYEDPKIIFYVSTKDFQSGTKLPKIVKSVIKDISTYLNIYSKTSSKKDNSVTLDSYINKETEEVKETLTKKKINVISLGTGEKIINQYPSKGIKLTQGSKLFLLTSKNDYIMPDMTGWSRSDVISYLNLIGITPNFEGNGYVTSQSLKKNLAIPLDKELTFKLAPKYIDNKKKDDK